jgi:hypothetical protein
MKNLTSIAEIFHDEPPHWGLRGDPYLWAEMARRFKEVVCPATPNSLIIMIEHAFAELTGFPISHRDDIYVERYSHGGMSSGEVSPEYWRNTALPLLRKRFSGTQEQEDR